MRCETKKLTLPDDRDTQALQTMLKAIESFAHQNEIKAFVIKARAQKGERAAGAVSFKIETLFQLSGTPIQFVSALALAKFAKGNMGGVPSTVLVYQKDAFRSAALYISKMVAK